MPGQDVGLRVAVPVRAYRLARERRIQNAEAAIALERLLEVLRSLPVIEAEFDGVELRAAAEAKWAAGLWHANIVPALDLLDAASQQLDAAAITAATKNLAMALGVKLRFERDDEIIEALADSSVPLSIGKVSRGGARPSEDLLVEQLGPLSQPPANLDVDAVVSGTRQRHAFARREAAGVQVLRPGPYGLVYDHHGLLLGDGSVVHFNGEADGSRKQNAQVRRVSFTRFLDKTPRAEVRSIIPRAVRSRQVVPLRPEVACLRALGAIGTESWTYSVLRRNCEHFATWSLLGASHSTQTRLAGQIQRWADLAPELVPVMDELVADDVTVERAVVPPITSSEGEDPLWYDLGRAFWDPDANDLVAWVPIWREGPPLAAADHPWRARALKADLTADSWMPVPPAALLEGSWHAALVAVVSGACDARPGLHELYWVLPDGSWVRESATFERLVEPRLRLAGLLVEALGTSLIEAHSDIYGILRGARSNSSNDLERG